MYSTIALSRYGSLEIKRAYRKNMIIGIMGAAMILSIGVVAYHCFADKSIIEPITLPPIPPDTVKIWDYRSYKPEIPKQTLSSADEKPIPKAGIPTPVPDDQVVDNSTIPTEDDLWRNINQQIPSDSIELDPSKVVIANPDDILPPPTEFIAVDEMPQAIETVTPVFPEMARISGVEGVVWVQVFVDKNGNPREVIILKTSGANAGFEESAIAAAKQTTWKPAFSNGQPVGVWVSYKIEFRLK